MIKGTIVNVGRGQFIIHISTSFKSNLLFLRVLKVSEKLLKITFLKILAENYAACIKDGHAVPVDAGEEIEMNLPDFADHERIKKLVD